MNYFPEAELEEMAEYTNIYTLKSTKQLITFS